MTGVSSDRFLAHGFQVIRGQYDDPDDPAYHDYLRGLDAGKFERHAPRHQQRYPCRERKVGDR